MLTDHSSQCVCVWFVPLQPGRQVEGEQDGGGENWFSSSRLPVPLASESDKIGCIQNGIDGNCGLKRPRAREITQWSIT